MSILERTRSLVVLNNDHAILELSLDLREMTKEEQRKRFGGSQKAGWFYLHANDQKRPGEIMECIVSPAGDYVSSLYRGHPVMESIGELKTTRERLIDALSEKIGLSHDSIGIDDAARGRTLGLEELATGQLIDLLTEQERGVKLIQPGTDNYGLDHIDRIGTTKSPDKQVGKSKIDEAGVMVVNEKGGVDVKSLKELDGL